LISAFDFLETQVQQAILALDEAPEVRSLPMIGGIDSVASYDNNTTDRLLDQYAPLTCDCICDYLRIRLSCNSNTEFIQIIGVRQLTCSATENELIPFFFDLTGTEYCEPYRLVKSGIWF